MSDDIATDMIESVRETESFYDDDVRIFLLK